MERKPYPFFFSVEFLAILVKAIATLSVAYPAMAAVGLFTIPSGFLFLGAIAQGLLDARNELDKHKNLYTNHGIAGRDKEEAIHNIALAQASEIAKTSHSTIEQVLDTKRVADLVDFAVKPSLAKSGLTLFSKLLGR